MFYFKWIHISICIIQLNECTLKCSYLHVRCMLHYSRLTFYAVVNPSVPDVRKCPTENKERQPNVSDVNMSVAVTSSCYNTTIDASYCGKTIKECYLQIGRKEIISKSWDLHDYYHTERYTVHAYTSIIYLFSSLDSL